VYVYNEKTQELKVNIRVKYLDYKKEFILDDIFLSLESLGQVGNFLSIILNQVEIVLDHLLLNSAVIITKKIPLGFSLTINSENKTLCEFEQLEIFSSFIAKSMFTNNFPPPAEFVDQFTLRLQKHFENRLIALDCDPNLLTLIKQFESHLQKEGLISKSIKLCPDTDSVSKSVNTKSRLDVLITVRDILIDEEVNTIQVENSTERGGISGLIGKYSSSNSKQNNPFIDLFKLETYHVSHQIQSIVEIIYSLLNQVVELDFKKYLSLI
jgi:hypothetical protein